MSSTSNHINKQMRPADVGILAIEIYFPKNCVNQDNLEVYDKVSQGKYTIGLGQNEMSFCYDNEDINSLCLTVVANLMEKHDIDYKSIGRLEVGTETVIDKSKSVKTVLMKLFEDSGNFDVEGVDTSNACYGGTNALFNAVAWIESSFWDGRLALVVCGDIAVYANGPARCTGGAGAVAMLIGPYAPLVLEPGIRSSYMRHAYDFYKPDLTSEYPVVDGKLSVQSYIQALDSCYGVLCKKANVALQLSNECFCLQNFDYVLFHCPFAKLVQKSFARLIFNDVVLGRMCFYSQDLQQDFDPVMKYKSTSLEESIMNRSIEKDFMSCSKKLFEKKTFPSLFIAKRTGNTYTPSLYSCLVSLLMQTPINKLVNTRIGLFSYGSGLASSMFSIRVLAQENHVKEDFRFLVKKFTLSQLITSLADIKSRLDSRVVVDPSTFAATLIQREKMYMKCDYKPQASVDSLFPGTFYLTEVDSNFRRTYSRKT